MRRALWWLGAGVLALVLLVVGTAPELVGGDTAGLAGMVGVVVLAGTPGLLVLGAVAVRRARHGDRTDPDPHGDRSWRRRH
ncbi:hypothetical protein [Egicoccus halophilus]|uniref:Uncharacterized protein n=1 Tax=Egicoccus halophilus TaxID=1670830 RepID=A0A8J3EQR2_9ACTN|nr:hypothetical protein [Egicoccus halophilus]GGI03084.1 hypothetical protein GCM10011354_02560 [Egicoccus halophilus]